MSKYKETLDVEVAINKLMKEDKSEELQLIYDFLNPIIENEKEKEFKRKRGVKTSWNKFIPYKEIAKASNVMTNSITYYDEAKDELHKYDQETQDVLHALELMDISDEQYSELAKDLQDIRKYRRQAKNFIEAVEPIRNFAKENQVLVKKMCKLNGEVIKLTNSIEERRYYARVRTSLQESFDKLVDAN
ncbi:MAG: hypothetical protein ACI35O_09035 [Bacillaceae bacterium]